MVNLLNYFKTVPPFSVWHSHPGQPARVLITAGVDGDEYASIEAAKYLIKNYRGTIPLTIIPIVNIAGNLAGTSLNPLDGRYPKYIYPGSPLGSSSSRLRYQLSKYTRGIDLWIDLHGGATDEHLIPFIWASENYPVLSHLSGKVLVENSIAKNVPYILLESGERGETKKSAIDQHLLWVHQILDNLDKPQKSGWEPTYTKVRFEKYQGQKVNSNTLWYSMKEYVSAN